MNTKNGGDTLCFLQRSPTRAYFLYITTNSPARGVLGTIDLPVLSLTPCLFWPHLRQKTPRLLGTSGFLGLMLSTWLTAPKHSQPQSWHGQMGSGPRENFGHNSWRILAGSLCFGFVCVSGNRPSCSVVMERRCLLSGEACAGGYKLPPVFATTASSDSRDWRGWRVALPPSLLLQRPTVALIQIKTLAWGVPPACLQPSCVPGRSG